MCHFGGFFPVWSSEEEKDKKENLPKRLWFHLIMRSFGYGPECGSGVSYTDTKPSHLRPEMGNVRFTYMGYS